MPPDKANQRCCPDNNFPPIRIEEIGPKIRPFSVLALYGDKSRFAGDHNILTYIRIGTRLGCTGLGIFYILKRKTPPYEGRNGYQNVISTQPFL